MTNPDPIETRRQDRQWVLAQFLLLGVATLAGIVEFFVVDRPVPLMLILAGVALIAGCIAILAKAAKDLGANLTAYPTPVDDCQLVDGGIYGLVRHPMYLALLLGMAGFGLVTGSLLVLVCMPLLVIFFNLKSRREERLLRARVPGYDAYTHRVRKRFIPFLI